MQVRASACWYAVLELVTKPEPEPGSGSATATAPAQEWTWMPNWMLESM
jgi:hypothetical protein